jgi:hypothetical protein
MPVRCSYCVADPAGAARFRGRDVAEMNLRHACAYKASHARGVPATWWAYAASFADECTMAGGNYNHECAEAILERMGFDGRALNAMDLCVGDTHADKPNVLMEAEQALQADADGTGAGSIIMMPTVRSGCVTCAACAISPTHAVFLISLLLAAHA